MNGKNILALVGAIVVGLIALKIVSMIFSVLWSAGIILIGAAVTGAVVYGLYRVFNNMLTSGKRLT